MATIKIPFLFVSSQNCIWQRHFDRYYRALLYAVVRFLVSSNRNSDGLAQIISCNNIKCIGTPTSQTLAMKLERSTTQVVYFVYTGLYGYITGYEREKLSRGVYRQKACRYAPHLHRKISIYEKCVFMPAATKLRLC